MSIITLSSDTTNNKEKQLGLGMKKKSVDLFIFIKDEND